MSWALVLLLAGRPLPVISWHASLEDCRAALERVEREQTGVERAVCESHRIPRLPPITGEILR
jgi:CBS domain-containing protein